MNRLAMGPMLDLMASNKWSVDGPFCTVELTLVDSGGWDLGGEVKREHYGSLHQALQRAFNLSTGRSRQ